MVSTMPSTAMIVCTGYLPQLPSTIITSATKLTVPGMPIEAMHATMKQPATNGIFETSPPSEGMSRLWV